MNRRFVTFFNAACFTFLALLALGCTVGLALYVIETGGVVAAMIATAGLVSLIVGGIAALTDF